MKKTLKQNNKIIFKCVNSIIRPSFNEKVTQKWDLWIPCTVHETIELIKGLKSQQLPATVHMNNSRCPLNECTTTGKKKKWRVKKCKRKRKSWIQTQPKKITVSLDGNMLHILCVCVFFLGLVYYSRDPQIRNLVKSTLKLGYTVLFTHLKIILLQCF